MAGGKTRSFYGAGATNVGRRYDSAGWRSRATGLGQLGRDKTVDTHIVAEPMSVAEGLRIYRADPLGARIVDLPPNEALRQGFVVSFSEEQETDDNDERRADSYEQLLARLHPSMRKRSARYPGTRLDSAAEHDTQHTVASALEALNLDKAIKQAWALSRAGGRSAILMGAVDYGELDQPLDLRRVRAFEWLNVLHPESIEPAYYYDDWTSAKHGQIAVWRYTPVSSRGVPVGASERGSTLIHESRLIVFEGPLVEPGQLHGDSIFMRLKRDLAGYHLNHQSVSVLLAQLAVGVHKVPGLAKLMERYGSDAYIEIAAQTDYGRSVTQGMIIDAEESYELHSVPLAGISDLLADSALKVSSSSGIPLVLLRGSAPGGMQSAEAPEVRFWYDNISGQQLDVVAPAVSKATDIILALNGMLNVAKTVEFEPLWQPTQKEICEAQLLQAKTDKEYYDIGALTADEIAKSRFRTPVFSYTTTVDWDARALAAEAINADRPDSSAEAEEPAEAADAIQGDTKDIQS